MCSYCHVLLRACTFFDSIFTVGNRYEGVVTQYSKSAAGEGVQTKILRFPLGRHRILPIGALCSALECGGGGEGRIDQMSRV